LTSIVRPSAVVSVRVSLVTDVTVPSTVRPPAPNSPPLPPASRGERRVRVEDRWDEVPAVAESPVEPGRGDGAAPADGERDPADRDGRRDAEQS
jgi:hypothetical protein